MTNLVKVEQTEIGRLIQRRAELEELVRKLKQNLTRLYPFSEETERKRRLDSLTYLKEGIADRIKKAEEYVNEPIIDPHIEVTNSLGVAEIELSNVRKQIKGYM